MNPQVLIVDDDEIVLFLHEMIIKESGLSKKPLCFINGSVVLRYLQENHQAMSGFVIFLDINMPVLNGWELLAALEKSSFREKIQVIMTSSSIDSADYKKAKNSPLVIQYVEKPLKLDICRQLRSMLISNRGNTLP